MSIELKPGDIFLTRSHSLLGSGIRFFTRQFGESKTRVNHVGLIVAGGELMEATAVEALMTVKRHPLWHQYGPPSTSEVAIYRATNLTQEEVDTIISAAESYVGRKYGFLKLLAHLGDWALQGAYLFRRLAKMDRYPICSWLVACAYAKADKTFGVAPGAASPDDIWDFIQKRPDIYTEILSLQRLEDANRRDLLHALT
jgi:hypothetical protein